MIAVSVGSPQAHASSLVDEIRSIHAGFGDSNALLAALRESVLLLPLTDDFRFFVTPVGNSAWLTVFTSGDALAAFVSQRSDVIERYASVTGARVVDQIAPSFPTHPGLIIDAAGDRPMAVTHEMLDR